MTFYGRLGSSRSRAQAFEAHLHAHPMRKLQLGTGTNALEGWFNTDLDPQTPDVSFLDSTHRFPFDDATFHYVYSEHHIEHLPYSDGLFMLRECYRILQPGGRVRIATPSLETLIGLYVSTPNVSQQRYIRFVIDTFLGGVGDSNAAFVINNAFRNWGHQFLYDRATLRDALEEAGFVNVTAAEYGESTDEQLRGIEMHGRFIGDEEISRFETMVLEGERPSQAHTGPGASRSS